MSMSPAAANSQKTSRHTTQTVDAMEVTVVQVR